MKQKMKKSVLCHVTAIFCLTMLFGVTVQAASLNPKNFFYVSVGTDISANSIEQPMAHGSRSDIIDWEQVVSSGESVSANLSRISNTGSSYPLPTVSSYTWRLVNKSGTRTSTLSGNSIYIPTTYSGGYLEVTANTKADDFWQASVLTSHAIIY